MRPPLECRSVRGRGQDPEKPTHCALGARLARPHRKPPPTPPSLHWAESCGRTVSRTFKWQSGILRAVPKMEQRNFTGGWLRLRHGMRRRLATPGPRFGVRHPARQGVVPSGATHWRVPRKRRNSRYCVERRRILRYCVTKCVEPKNTPEHDNKKTIKKQQFFNKNIVENLMFF